MGINDLAVFFYYFIVWGVGLYAGRLIREYNLLLKWIFQFRNDVNNYLQIPNSFLELLAPSNSKRALDKI